MADADAKPADQTPRARIESRLRFLYGASIGADTGRKIEALVARHRTCVTSLPADQPLSERDALLITYADQVQEPGVAPLQSLAAFCEKHLAGIVSGVHLLPFYPWSSDDGFAVKDFFAVAPEFGTWDDIAKLRGQFELMFDAVFNHLSAQSDWFQRFLRDEPGFRDFFVTVTGHPDLTQVVRPRALPLLTEFSTARGPEKVWTTFSADQVDVNAQNPRVLLALLEALLFYVQHGARFIRLDAIAYLWKEIGTPCIHRPQTHAVIQLLRAVLDEVAPSVQLITETNVPHADNLSYFGDGTNEAQLVYNFALPPLVLHTVLRGDATRLTRWAGTLQAPSDRTTFFNFLASHDGIGLNPARGILSPAEIDFLAARCLAHGGFINYKHDADGSKSPYELNIVYFDAVNDPTAAESQATQANRFLVTQSIMLSLAGVPGIYFHSLFGSRNDRAGALQTGINRRINRQKLARAGLAVELGTPESLRAVVFGRFGGLLKARREHAAFSPRAAQQVLDADARLFAVLRIARQRPEWVLCLHNVTNQPVTLTVTATAAAAGTDWTELLTQRSHSVGTSGTVRVTLPPYEVNWLAGLGPRPYQLTVV